MLNVKGMGLMVIWVVGSARSPPCAPYSCFSEVCLRRLLGRMGAHWFGLSAEGLLVAGVAAFCVSGKGGFPSVCGWLCSAMLRTTAGGGMRTGEGRWGQVVAGEEGWAQLGAGEGG